MKTQIREFLHEEDGITALEYGVLAAIITAAIVIFATAISGGLGTLGTKLKGILEGTGGGGEGG